MSKWELKAEPLKEWELLEKVCKDRYVAGCEGCPVRNKCKRFMEKLRKAEPFELRGLLEKEEESC